MGKQNATKGQALIEFVLVVSLLMLVILAMFDLGFAVYAQNTISNAAREGARRGIIPAATDAQIANSVASAAPSLSNLQISISPSPSRTFGQPITVTVTWTYTPITPVIGQIVTGSGLVLRAVSTMIVD